MDARREVRVSHMDIVYILFIKRASTMPNSLSPQWRRSKGWCGRVKEGGGGGGGLIETAFGAAAHIAYHNGQQR